MGSDIWEFTSIWKNLSTNLDKSILVLNIRNVFLFAFCVLLGEFLHVLEEHISHLHKPEETDGTEVAKDARLKWLIATALAFIQSMSYFSYNM